MIVAIFDFDNTITDRDILLPFLFFTNGNSKTIFKLIQLTPYFIAFLFKLIDRQQIKEKILSKFFQDWPKEKIISFAQKFIAQKVPQFVKNEAINKLVWHQEQGHYCLLVSANIDILVKEWGKKAGFRHVISSLLEFDSQGFVTGKLNGKNCWGREKKKRIELFLKDKKTIIYAYGDSRGDKEMLEMADYPFYKCF